MIGFEYLNKIDVPIFTITFCAIILIIYILDNFLIIPKTETVSLKEKLWSGHNKGYINHALHLSEKKIKSGHERTLRRKARTTKNFFVLSVYMVAICYLLTADRWRLATGS